MNNWRLLLLAVVALLQPISSFTEGNLIDGHRECCDHRSNSGPDDSRLYGTYRKTSPDERRLSTRDDIREVRRYETREDPVARSRDRLILEKSARRVSRELALRSIDQEHRQRSFSEGREVRERVDQSLRNRETLFRDSRNQYERDALDSRRIRMHQDDNRSARIINDRVSRNIETHEARNQNVEHSRRMSPNRENRATLQRETLDVSRTETRRESRDDSFRSESRLSLDKNSEGRALKRIGSDDGLKPLRFRSLDSRVMNRIIREGEVAMTRRESREDRRAIFENKEQERRVDDRRQQRDQNRHKLNAIRRYTRENTSTYQRRDFHSHVEEKINRMNVRNMERVDERRQQRDDHRLLNIRESRRTELRQAAGELIRESRILTATVPSVRMVRSNEIMYERRQSSRALMRESRDDSTIQRRHETRDSRDSREALTPSERSVRSDVRRDERRELSDDRVTMMRQIRDSRAADRDITRPSRVAERRLLDQRSIGSRKEIRSTETIDMRMEQRDERHSVDRNTLTLRLSRENTEPRQKSHRSVSLSRSMNLRESGDNELNRRERDDRRTSRERTISRAVERRGNEESRNVFSERASSEERVARNRGQMIKIKVGQEIRDETRASGDRIVMARLARYSVTAQRSFDTPSATRIIEVNERFERTRSLDINEKREVRGDRRESRNKMNTNRIPSERVALERHEARENSRDSRINARDDVTRNREARSTQRFERQIDDRRESRDRTFTNRLSTKRKGEERRFRESSRDVRDAIRNEVSRNRDIGERFDVRRQQNERTSRDKTTRTYTTERIIRDTEENFRYERVTRNRDDKRTSERDVRRNIRDSRAETRRESRTADQEVSSFRFNLAMERMDNRAIPTMRTDAKLRSSNVPARDVRMSANRRNSHRELIETRFRNIESKARENTDDVNTEEVAMNWQLVFYTLQGAYLCSLLIQLLTENTTNKGKTRSFVWWNSSKDLIKVD